MQIFVKGKEERKGGKKERRVRRRDRGRQIYSLLHGNSQASGVGSGTQKYIHM